MKKKRKIVTLALKMAKALSKSADALSKWVFMVKALSKSAALTNIASFSILGRVRT